MTLDDAEALIADGRYAEAEIACAPFLQGEQRDRAIALFRQISALARENAPVSAVPDEYHRWFYNTLRWKNRSWLGVSTLKSPLDMWNYQELIMQLRPTLIVEYGTHAGGAALFFAHLAESIAPDARVIAVDVSLAHVASSARAHRAITFIEGSSIDPTVTAHVATARNESSGPAFFILDSDHSASHVYQELVSLRPIVRPGDYVVVEDGNINGHPVLPDCGPGPTEALLQYQATFPNDYARDTIREQVFGWTFAPGGFLIRS